MVPTYFGGKLRDRVLQRHLRLRTLFFVFRLRPVARSNGYRCVPRHGSFAFRRAPMAGPAGGSTTCRLDNEVTAIGNTGFTRIPGAAVIPCLQPTLHRSNLEPVSSCVHEPSPPRQKRIDDTIHTIGISLSGKFGRLFGVLKMKQVQASR